MDYENMLECILEWAKINPRFNTSTIEGIKEHYENYYYFTLMQMEAIENVYYKWKIDKWYKSNFN